MLAYARLGLASQSSQVHSARSDLTSFNLHGSLAIQAFNSTVQTLKLYKLLTDLSVGQHVINRRRQPTVVVPSKALPARATQQTRLKVHKVMPNKFFYFMQRLFFSFFIPL